MKWSKLKQIAEGLLDPDAGIEQGACLACGYDLTGNISGICPECGKRK